LTRSPSLPEETASTIPDTAVAPLSVI
jgi:hypothetical protein